MISISKNHEINGLRAVAVILVILFHAGIETFSGGYLGVDIFYVVSGYLITSIIYRELDEFKSFNYLDFYLRRLRRIVPMLYVVLLVTIPFAYSFFTLQDLLSYSESLISSAFFYSNILFWRKSGYFDLQSIIKPLLHTWSLSVEFQFYILYPILLIAILRKAKNHAYLILITLSIFLLIFSNWAVEIFPAAAFYLLPTRAWELLIGSFCFLISIKSNKILLFLFKRAHVSIIGFVLILISSIFFNNHTPTPSFYTAIPALGTCLILISLDSNSFINRFLSNSYLKIIGLMSYSLYLWHWPFFVFIQYQYPNKLSPIYFILCLIIIIPLSYLSWKFIENPFRNKYIIKNKLFILIVITILFIVISFGVIGLQNDLLKKYFNKSILNEVKINSNCYSKDLSQFIVLKECFSDLGGGNAPIFKFAVFGDSHADALIPAFDLIATEKALSYGYSATAGCPPLLGLDVSKGAYSDNTCLNFTKAQYEFANKYRPSVIFLVARWSLYTSGVYEKKIKGNYFLIREPNDELSVQVSRKNFNIGLEGTIQAYKKIGIKIILVEQVPQQKIDSIRLYSHLKLLGVIGTDVATKEIDRFSLPLSDHLDLHKYYKSVVKKFNDDGMMDVVSVDHLFCESLKCKMGDKFEPYYVDFDHLSAAGAMLVSNALKSKL